MRETGMVGTRIRQRRLVLGMKQAQLAQAAGISASYLNLIEHNRRRIGGKTLLQLADALKTEPSTLSVGADASLLAALEAACDAMAHVPSSGAEVEIDRLEDFAGRFPGWAGLISQLENRRQELERLVQLLTERLANDPLLSEALHEVISTVTSIRSAASILVETHDLEPQWQMRFHRNLNEDSARLASGAEALVRYLDAPPEAASHIIAPSDEVEGFLEENNFHFPLLEQVEREGVATIVSDLVAQSNTIETEQAQSMVRDLLALYAQDARRLPLADMHDLIARHGLAVDHWAKETGLPFACVLRRVAFLPSDVAGPTGLVVMDNVGRILTRKPVLGFAPSRSGAGCALWPLHECLANPDRPVRARLQHDQHRLLAMAVAEQMTPASFDQPGLRHAYMLVVPDPTQPSARGASLPGSACGICGQTSCPAAPV